LSFASQVVAEHPITGPPQTWSSFLILPSSIIEITSLRDRAATRATVLVLVLPAVAVDIEEIHQEFVRARSRASATVPLEDIAGILHRVLSSSGELLIFLFHF
jgi:hypothetical protein